MKIRISPIIIQGFEQIRVGIRNSITKFHNLIFILKLILKLQRIDLPRKLILLTKLTSSISDIGTTLNPRILLFCPDIRSHSPLIQRFRLIHIDNSKYILSWLIAFYPICLISFLLEVVVIAVTFRIGIDSCHQPILAIFVVYGIQVSSFKKRVKN